VASQPTAVGGSENALLPWLIPVGRSPWAIAAGYCGLLSLGCALLGPLGIIFGALAIRDIKRRRGVTGLPRAILGIVLGTLGTLLLVLLALSLVLSPNLSP
jgi:ABC-type branched-subunit amino acid transport system permease subunit